MIIFSKKSRVLRCQTFMVAKYEQSKRVANFRHRALPLGILNADEKRALHRQSNPIMGPLRTSRPCEAEELGQLSMIEKVVSLWNGLIVGAIRHCRLNVRTDSRMSVLTIITFLADNNEATEAK
jgi:hypothetical protein